MSDLLRDLRFTVVDLGADTPPESFARAARDAHRLHAVCLGASAPDLDEAISATIGAVKAAGVTVPVLVGGGAVDRPRPRTATRCRRLDRARRPRRARRHRRNRAGSTPTATAALTGRHAL